jgi:membrane-associated phospholipid phosphatase
MRISAKIISNIFHPLLMPVIGLLIIFNTDSYINYTIPIDLKKAVIILIATSTFIIPLLISLLLLNRKLINSLEMETSKERIIPYAFTIVFYVFTLYMLKQAPIPPVIFNFIIGATLSVIMAFIINIKWKISAHMIGIGGLFGALLCISLILEVYVTPYIILSLIVAGLVGSSRIILNAHNSPQIYAGFLLGVICQVISIYL